ncbi:ATP-binding protein [Ideonella sp. A 288]|uniref:ATP-binding protein n=1 Tax=Ideonella sp. A 288 TaxID=1962181 RepID=UPI000B4AEB54|nr:AAA family ATPase [Ideonella sp. A 288]
MRLHRLKVDQLRQFRQPFELAGLEPGLNLFSGPNEAGKSTLVRALRAAFFERHRSGSVEDLLPWGEPSAAPSVELDFSIGGTDYRLRKSFMHRKRCELKVGPRDLDGEDAEQHLAALLGFRFAGKGASKAEHWGIPGLLWIEQGSGQDIDDPLKHAADHLRKALDQMVGDVASSQGDDVIGRVRSEREALLTATGKPRAAYAEALLERDAAGARVQELDARIAQYRDQVDQLGQLRAEHAADAAARPWDGFRTQQQQAEQALATIQALRLQIDVDRASLRQVEDTLKLVDEQLAGHEDQHRALRQREADLLEAERLVQSAGQADDTWAAARREAQATCDQAAEALVQAQQADLRATLARRVGDALARITALTDAIGRAEAEQAQLSAQRRLAVETELGKADLARLRDQHARLTELRIRQDAAATRVRFDIAAGAKLTLAGERLSGRGEHLITSATDIDIPQVGRLQIVPGGADLADLARDEADQRAAHLALLQRLGVASLDEAEARCATHQQALKDIQHSEKALAHLAPKGLDDLRAELGEHTVRRTEAEGQLQLLGPIAAPADRPSEPLAQATARHKAASAHLDQVARQATEAAHASSTARTQRDAALRERGVLAALLGDAARQQRERDTAQRRLAARAERDALGHRIAARQAEVDQARPDILAQDAVRFQRSADQAERAFSERQTRLTLLQGKLEEAGAQGLEEARAEQVVRAQAAVRRSQELERRAQALDLLLGLLEARRRDLTKRLQAPLQRHVNRYLQLLFPQASLDIGDDLAPGQLTRPGSRGAESGPVGSLSFGAREQMGVISRLAYADLLKEAGRPTLIILDDALVHSDDQRLEQMKRVLFDAAQRHQVLLFTCHPALWRDLGAVPRAIGPVAATLA